MSADFSFLIPLGFTILLEVLTAVLIGIRRKRQLLLVVLVNILTNPLLHLLAGIVYTLAGKSLMRIVVFAVLEPLVILTEGWIYRIGLEVSHPFRASLIMNLVTMIGGVLWMLL